MLSAASDGLDACVSSGSQVHPPDVYYNLGGSDKHDALFAFTIQYSFFRKGQLLVNARVH